MDSVNEIAIRGVAADGFAQDLADARVAATLFRDARIIIDKSHGTQDSAHAKCCNQLIAGYACTVDGDFGEAIIPVGERYMLRGGEPVSNEILTHAQAQTADDDEA